MTLLEIHMLSNNALIGMIEVHTKMRDEILIDIDKLAKCVKETKLTDHLFCIRADIENSSFYFRWVDGSKVDFSLGATFSNASRLTAEEVKPFIDRFSNTAKVGYEILDLRHEAYRNRDVKVAELIHVKSVLIRLKSRQDQLQKLNKCYNIIGANT